MSRADAATPAIGLIWAVSGGIIGRDGGMPWHVPEDLAHFKAVTLGAPVIMGRKTWDSLPPRFRPLPGRSNLVVTRQADWAAEGALRAASVDEALSLAAADRPERVWVIGGAELFRQVLPRADRLEVTELRAPDGGAVVAPAPGDVAAPAIDPSRWRVASDPPTGMYTSRSGIRYRFLSYTR